MRSLRAIEYGGYYLFDDMTASRFSASPSPRKLYSAVKRQLRMGNTIPTILLLARFYWEVPLSVCMQASNPLRALQLNEL